MGRVFNLAFFLVFFIQNFIFCVYEYSSDFESESESHSSPELFDKDSLEASIRSLESDDELWSYAQYFKFDCLDEIIKQEDLVEIKNIIRFIRRFNLDYSLEYKNSLSGRTFLHVACLNLDLEIIKDLIELGADILIVDDKGYSSYGYIRRLGEVFEFEHRMHDRDCDSIDQAGFEQVCQVCLEHRLRHRRWERVRDFFEAIVHVRVRSKTF